MHQCMMIYRNRDLYVPAVPYTKNVFNQKWQMIFFDDFCESSTLISPETGNGELLISNIEDF